MNLKIKLAVVLLCSILTFNSKDVVASDLQAVQPMDIEPIINYDNVKKCLGNFKDKDPFDYCVVDNFFHHKYATQLANDFPDYDDKQWNYYNNLIENKKTLNRWDKFPTTTYRAFTDLLSNNIAELLSDITEVPLNPEYGLHGGGWHMHGKGGNLNPHLDYSIHPKLNMQRKINIIIYLSPELNPKKHGGHLGMYKDGKNDTAGELVKEIEPVFNRAVIFDTTQNSWHGMSRKFAPPHDSSIYRKSMAVYYTTIPSTGIRYNKRALFSPRENQLDNEDVKQIIKKRVNVSTSQEVYNTSK